MTPKSTVLKLFLTAAVGGSVVGLVGGCGNTDGGDAGRQNYDGSSFVDTDGAAGSVELQLADGYLKVSESAGFSFRVKDANGNPVPNVQIACDTEKGVALIEPSTGFEMTDAYGQISGKFGCELPGSYQMACRMPVGGNKRKYATVHCEGPVPSGFTGFAGAGGGTLGTGTGSGDSGDNQTSGSVSISSVSTIENDGNTVSIDVIQDLCTNGTETTPEPFTDTLVKVKISNTTSVSVNVYAYEYVIPNSGREISRTVYFSNAGDVGAKSSTEFSGLFLKAGSGKKYWMWDGDIYSESVPQTTGQQNIKFTVYYHDALGNSKTTEASVGMTFGDYNKCTTTN